MGVVQSTIANYKVKGDFILVTVLVPALGSYANISVDMNLQGNSCFVLCCFLMSFYSSSLCQSHEVIHVYQGNPFHRSNTSVNTLILNKERDGVPMHTEIYYPSSPGTYAPVLFAPGLNGVVYPELYSTVLSNFAAYGYIVIGVDPFWPVAPELAHLFKRREVPTVQDISEKLPEETFRLLQWLVDNLNGNVLAKTEVANITADWRYLGLLSHSLGADTLIQMIQQNKTFAKAVAFLEPGSDHLKEPLDYSIPTLSYGTQLCMEFPNCCIKGNSYFHFYDNAQCPKILMNATDYGHCDILNEIPGWELCHVSDFCKTDKSNNRDLYREVFMPGVLSAFFGTYIQGNTALVKYIVTRDLMPIELGQLESSINC